jgi:hypothetical protein
MTAGRKPTPTLLKLISGGGDHHRERLRDDKPKIDAPPCVPPTATLTEDEQQMWRWLLEHVYIPHVHGSADALLFAENLQVVGARQPSRTEAAGVRLRHEVAA